MNRGASFQPSRLGRVPSGHHDDNLIPQLVSRAERRASILSSTGSNDEEADDEDLLKALDSATDFLDRALSTVRNAQALATSAASVSAAAAAAAAAHEASLVWTGGSLTARPSQTLLLDFLDAAGGTSLASMVQSQPTSPRRQGSPPKQSKSLPNLVTSSRSNSRLIMRPPLRKQVSTKAAYASSSSQPSFSKARPTASAPLVGIREASDHDRPVIAAISVPAALYVLRMSDPEAGHGLSQHTNDLDPAMGTAAVRPSVTTTSVLPVSDPPAAITSSTGKKLRVFAKFFKRSKFLKGVFNGSSWRKQTLPVSHDSSTSSMHDEGRSTPHPAATARQRPAPAPTEVVIPRVSDPNNLLGLHIHHSPHHSHRTSTCSSSFDSACSSSSSTLPLTRPPSVFQPAIPSPTPPANPTFDPTTLRQLRVSSPSQPSLPQDDSPLPATSESPSDTTTAPQPGRALAYANRSISLPHQRHNLPPETQTAPSLPHPGFTLQVLAYHPTTSEANYRSVTSTTASYHSDSPRESASIAEPGSSDSNIAPLPITTLSSLLTSNRLLSPSASFGEWSDTCTTRQVSSCSTPSTTDGCSTTPFSSGGNSPVSTSENIPIQTLKRIVSNKYINAPLRPAEPILE